MKVNTDGRHSFKGEEKARGPLEQFERDKLSPGSERKLVACLINECLITKIPFHQPNYKKRV